MTSTTVSTVDGIQVIADEPVESPLSTPSRPVYFTRIRRLLLADESTVYGCTECAFTASAPGTVRAHLGDHAPESRPGRRTKGTPPPLFRRCPWTRRSANCSTRNAGRRH